VPDLDARVLARVRASAALTQLEHRRSQFAWSLTALVYSSGYDGLIHSIGFLVGWPIIMFLIAERLRNLGSVLDHGRSARDEEAAFEAQ